MKITQAKIDEAVLLGKSAAYHLAYELSLEVKFGGKMGCCICNLKLLWLWTNTLACMNVVEGELVGCLNEEKTGDVIEKIKGMCKFATGSKTLP